MVDSDHEVGEMDRLEISSDSTDIIIKKRPRIEDSEDEAKNVSTKKKRNFSNEQSEILKKDNSEIDSDKNGTVMIKEHTVYSENEQNIQEKFLSESNTDKEDEEDKEKQDHKPIKQKNGNKSLLDKDDSIVDENSFKINHKEKIIKIKKEEDGSNEEINVDKVEEKSKEEEINKGRIVKNRTVDTEIVGGLELSVECASDKEESSSESEDEKEIKSRPKTEIILDLNESDCRGSLSEAEKSDSQEVTNTLEIKSEKAKKKRSRTTFSKLKASESEGDSLNNNSDEDYSPRTKKKMKKSPMTSKPKRSVEPKRGRGVKKYSYKKNTEDISDDESVDSTERINKTKTKDKMEEELSEKESSASKSESNNNSEDEESSVKNRRTRRSNAEPENNRQIQILKKYLKVAGIRIKCFNDLWADCKSNSAKIKRLKELLEKNGISGRPTLEKCKRAKKKNERMREVSELDVANIISEGRVTRARNKKSTSPEIPQRYRETRKRIQTIIDSDSE